MLSYVQYNRQQERRKHRVNYINLLSASQVGDVKLHSE